jgi:hypothetical protein
MRRAFSPKVRKEKFSPATSFPASTSPAKTTGGCAAGPRVHTILAPQLVPVSSRIGKPAAIDDEYTGRAARKTGNEPRGWTYRFKRYSEGAKFPKRILLTR